MRLSEVIRKFSLDELKQEWQRVKPDTVDGMVSFLTYLGFDESERSLILQKSGIPLVKQHKFQNAEQIRNIVDVAKEADIVPHVLKFLSNSLGVRESMLKESVEKLTDDEIRAILSTLFDLSKRYTQHAGIEKFESVKHSHPGTYSQLVLAEVEDILSGRSTIELEEYKTLAIALLEANVSWVDLGLKEIVKEDKVLLVDPRLIKHLNIIDNLIELKRRL